MQRQGKSGSAGQELRFERPYLLIIDVSKHAGRVANSVDPEQMLCSEASDMGLHSLVRSVSSNTYVNTVFYKNRTPYYIILDPALESLRTVRNLFYLYCWASGKRYVKYSVTVTSRQPSLLLGKTGFARIIGKR